MTLASLRARLANDSWANCRCFDVWTDDGRSSEVRSSSTSSRFRAEANTSPFLRLGDAGLWIEVERDLCVYGDECKFGGGEQHTTSLLSLPTASFPAIYRQRRRHVTSQTDQLHPSSFIVNLLYSCFLR
jgi:hypothetical protein